MGRRRNVEANHIAHLGNEVRIGGELEGLQPVRLQAEGAPNPLHRRNRQAARSRHAARTPVRRIRRYAFERAHDHRLDAGVLDRPRRPAPGRIAQSIHAMLDKTSAPLADSGLIDLQIGRDLLVLFADRAVQHDPRPQGQRLRGAVLCRAASDVSSARSASLSTKAANCRPAMTHSMP